MLYFNTGTSSYEKLVSLGPAVWEPVIPASINATSLGGVVAAKYSPTRGTLTNTTSINDVALALGSYTQLSTTGLIVKGYPVEKAGTLFITREFDGTTNYIVQRYVTTDSVEYTRYYKTNWTSPGWLRTLTSANLGAKELGQESTGIDADRLDGQHGSYYLAATGFSKTTVLSLLSGTNSPLNASSLGPNSRSANDFLSPERHTNNKLYSGSVSAGVAGAPLTLYNSDNTATGLGLPKLAFYDLARPGSGSDVLKAKGAQFILNRTSDTSTVDLFDADGTTKGTLGVKILSATDVNTTNVTSSLVTSANVYVTSDLRKKKDLVKIEGALAKTRALTGYLYKMRDTDKESAGIIAQDLQKVLPEAVTEMQDGFLAVDTQAIISILVEAIKELGDRTDG